MIIFSQPLCGSISLTGDNARKIDIGKCATSFYPLVDYYFEKHTSQLFVKYHFTDRFLLWSTGVIVSYTEMVLLLCYFLVFMNFLKLQKKKTKLPFITDTVKSVHVNHLPSGFPCFKITFKFHYLLHLFMTCGIGERLEICRQNVFTVLGLTSSSFMHFQKSRETNFYVFLQFFAIIGYFV